MSNGMASSEVWHRDRIWFHCCGHNAKESGILRKTFLANKAREPIDWQFPKVWSFLQENKSERNGTEQTRAQENTRDEKRTEHNSRRQENRTTEDGIEENRREAKRGKLNKCRGKKRHPM